MKICLLLLLATTAAAGQSPAVSRISPGDIESALEPIRQKYGLPALGGAILTDPYSVVAGVTGVRKFGTTVAATAEDEWHLGSDTKAMTATVIAQLVEKGLLRWESTIGEIFGAEAQTFSPEFRNITLLELLSHHAGLQPNLAWGTIAQSGGSVMEERRRSLTEAARSKLQSKPGTEFSYSNLGYVLAGAVAEHATGKSWEELMREIVFRPLRITECGFGGSGTPAKIDQPWPHTSSGHPMPENGPAVDNPAVLGPAGTVHCSLQAWSKFVADQLAGERGAGKILKQETYRFLHTPPFGGYYALGWGVVDRPWGGGKVLTHAGSNTMNYAVVWAAPLKQFAVLVVTNQGDDQAAKACDEAASALIKMHQGQ